MSAPLRLFITAGEPSGDHLAADLVRRLRSRTPVELSGVGGSELGGEGLRSLFPMSDLSVMGVVDVLARLPLLLDRVRKTAEAIVATAPDIAVLVDSQVFSARVARQARRAGYRGRMILYVAPSVWAYRPQRAAALRPLFDEVLAVLPFEPAAMQRLGGPPTRYVGHPALGRTMLRPALVERGPLLLLPGSRNGELRRHLPLMRYVAETLAGHPRISGFVLPTPPSREQRVRAAVAEWTTPVAVVAGEDEKRAAFGEAVAAAAVSGTVTLELALSGVPTVATYVADLPQGLVARYYKVAFATLPNILMQRAVIPEVLDIRPHPDRVAAEMRRLLDDPALVPAQAAAFTQIRTLMEKGAPEAPLTDAAEAVLAVAQRTAIGV